jgi:hypothetical protein
MNAEGEAPVKSAATAELHGYQHSGSTRPRLLLSGERSSGRLATAACRLARNAGADRCGVRGSWISSIAGVGPAS